MQVKDKVFAIVLGGLFGIAFGALLGTAFSAVFANIESAVAPTGLVGDVVQWCEGQNKQEAARLAFAFEEVAQRAHRLNPQQIVSLTGKKTDAAMPDGWRHRWQPVMSQISDRLNQMARAGQLDTPEDHVQTWRQIGRGFTYYASST